MSLIAYAEKIKGKYKRFFFTDHSPVKSDVSEKAQKALMMSRLDFEVKAIELPHIRERDIPDFLRYKIRSIYPGNPEDTVFDYILFRFNNKKIAVLFITQSKVLKQYKDVSRGKPLILPMTVIQGILKKNLKKKAVILFWQKSWVEVITINGENKDNFFFSSSVIKRNQDFSKEILKIKSLIDNDFKESRHLIFAFKQEKEMILNSNEWVKNNLEFYPIMPVLDKGITKKSYLFHKKKSRIIIPFKYLIQMLLFMLILCCCGIYIKFLEFEKEYYNKLKQSFGVFETQIIKIITEKKAVEELEEELLILREKKPVNIYLMMSELTRILGTDTRIKSFLLEKNSFQIEAEGKNPLNIMEVFKNSDFFSNVKLRQVIPEKDSSKQVYKISGYINAE